MRAQRRVEHVMYELAPVRTLALALYLLSRLFLIRFLRFFLSCQHQRSPFLVSS